MPTTSGEVRGLYIKVTTLVERNRILTAVEKAARQAYLQMGYIVQRSAKASMVEGDGQPSTAPHPPNVQTSHLATSIQVAMIERGGKGFCIVGPTARSKEGFNYSAFHEFTKRPYMKPALLREANRFPDLMRGLPILDNARLTKIAKEQQAQITWKKRE